jgi:hypothetical protein
MNRACGDARCSASAGIHNGLTNAAKKESAA